MRWHVSPGGIEGSIEVPGDKSISHRALLLAALASGASTIQNLSPGEDVLSTASCLRALGVRIDITKEGASVLSTGSLAPSPGPLDAGNSGTTMRLLAGILAGQLFSSTITGDESLRRRPMIRIIEPLTQMGGTVRGRENRAPLRIETSSLHGIQYRLPVASAQVKSCILLAALFADGQTTVDEPAPTRDHTERMLLACGIDLRRDGSRISVTGGARPLPMRLAVPGDISSAAFFLTGAALAGSTLEVRRTGVNPTRTGLLAVLRRMGLQVRVSNESLHHGEPVGDVSVAGRVRASVDIEAPEVPLLVDELPLVALLATQAPGISTIRGAGELRIKETDRIATVATSLRSMGADIDELPDGFVIRGPTPLRGATLQCFGDHRLAMMLAVAGTVASTETIITGAEASAISYPDFDNSLRKLSGHVVAA
ncbi:MAG: 3-phosphoshikimate 1-carboxyvinyltransferase [Chloroflexota bacterium]